MEHELTEAGLEHVNIADVTPDGAADGQAALNDIPGLAEKINTCHLHGLQRALLFSVGLAGASSKNPAAKSLLRKHSRVTTLAVQSRQVAYGIREKQVAAGIPVQKILTLETGKNATRWAGQYKRLTRNCLLRPVIDPVVDQYKRDNRGGDRRGQRGRVGLARRPCRRRLCPRPHWRRLGHVPRARGLPRVPVPHQGAG